MSQYYNPGTLIAVKSEYREPEEEMYVCMILDQEIDPDDSQYYALRYKILKPDATIGYINLSAMFAYERIS